jgi:hypothetical protein
MDFTIDKIIVTNIIKIKNNEKMRKHNLLLEGKFFSYEP